MVGKSGIDNFLDDFGNKAQIRNRSTKLDRSDPMCASSISEHEVSFHRPDFLELWTLVVWQSLSAVVLGKCGRLSQPSWLLMRTII